LFIRGKGEKNCPSFYSSKEGVDNMKKLIILNLVVLSITTLLWAQERCEAPVWNVGDSWRYRTDNKKEREYKVLGVEDFKNTKIYVVESRYGFNKKGFDIRTLELKVDISPDGKKIVPMTDWNWFYDFPLYVGKKWEKMTEGKTAVNTPRNYVFTYKVLSFENVTVPAGTFKAFKIESEQRSMAHISNTFVTYLWYSPEVKREVKFQPGPHSGDWRITEQGYELKSFKLVEKQPTIPEIKSSTDMVEPPRKPQVSPSEKPQVIPTEKPKISIPVTPPQDTNFVTVTGTSANIRSGAGNEFPIVTTVKQGDKLILLGEHGEWLNVRLENGQDGWINSRFVKE
jgi:hypothetical protein